MAQAVAKDERTTSKAKLLNAFHKILAERRSLSSRVATREEAEKARNRSVLETVSQYTADSIVRGLADLQLDFGTIITGLSTRLTTGTDKLAAKIKADLLAKEWESAQQGYELQMQLLETKIQKQTEQINEISTQLQTALR